MLQDFGYCYGCRRKLWLHETNQDSVCDSCARRAREFDLAMTRVESMRPDGGTADAAGLNPAEGKPRVGSNPTSGTFEFFEEFVSFMRGRLEQGESLFGTRFYDKTEEELDQDINEELFDAANYLYFIFAKRRKRAQSAKD